VQDGCVAQRQGVHGRYFCIIEQIERKLMMENLTQEALSDPKFDALTIKFEEDAAGDLEVQAAALLETAVNEALNSSAEGWQVEPVHETMPRTFDLLPPPGHTISVKEGFDLQNSLNEQASLQYAEALFETNSDNFIENELPDAPDLSGPIATIGSLEDDWDELSTAERNPMWNHEMVSSEAAWELSRGEGIIVGHPDSGYITHVELDDDRIRHDLEFDVYNRDRDAENSEARGGNHGLSTASVLMSGEAKQNDTHYVIGVAPAAQLIPYRITEGGPPIFLSRTGPRHVRNAIVRAVESGCHVLSMSLGGLPEKSMRDAIREAVKQNVILCAAAGNVVRMVVWPARYKEVIAVAACTAYRRRWIHSSRGSTVDVTAPGHNVWRAMINEFGQQQSKPGSGTSYATPHVAGIAALWLAFHGRNNLISQYPRMPLYVVFREVIKEACDDPPVGHRNRFGAGIVNAENTLKTTLPDEDELLAKYPDESFAALGVAAMVESEALESVFDVLPADETRGRLASLLAVPEASLDAKLKESNQEELTFHIATQPALRAYLTRFDVGDAASAAQESTAEGFPGSEAFGVMDFHGALLASGLSDQLRTQIGEP
jgi:thermitase